MKLSAVSLDFKSGDLDLRVKALNLKKIDLKNHFSNASEILFLGTCNRVELYSFGEISSQDLLSKWSELCALNSEELQHFKIYQDLYVADHLFRVASSLESMVVGESQILGQVKEAYEEAARVGTVGPVLHKLFQKTLRMAKRVRSETDVGRFPVSVPSIAVRLAEKVVGSMGERIVAIMGLGDMGRLAAEYFSSIQPKELILYNRTKSKAEEVASKLVLEGIKCRVVENPVEAFRAAHVVVSAVDGITFKEQDLKEFLNAEEPRFIVDLSVPPSVEAVNNTNLFLYSVDDLQKMAAENSQLREQELKKAEAMIMLGAERVWKEFRSIHLKDAILRLENKVGILRNEELQYLKARLSDLSEEEWAEVVKMSERLTSRVLKDPLMQMRIDLETSESSEPLIHFFKNLFKI